MKLTPLEEKAALDHALDEFANDMRSRLHEMVDKGKGGWDDPQWAQQIADDMSMDAWQAFAHGDRHHLHDIANRAMMLWWQEWRMSGRCKVEVPE